MSDRVQTISDPKTGEPAFAVVPIDEYAALVAQAEEREDVVDAYEGLQYLRGGGETFPAEVIDAIGLHGQNPVKVYREYRGLSQTQLADKAGLRQASVSEAERGAAATVATLRKLAKALGVDFEQLLSPED